MTTQTAPQPGGRSEDSRNLTAEFVKRLAKLDRGDRAVLRRCAGLTLAEAGSAHRVFYRNLPHGVRDEEIYFLVATLYCLNKREHKGDMGATMLDLKAKTSAGTADRRMAILLDSEFERIDGRPGGGELAYRLRQLVRYAASKEVGINWVQLIDDLSRWSYPEKRVQKRWARAYFQGPKAIEDEEE